ncbi:hypothetical protein ACFL0W_06060 [Nanoarchaeota archaeon]
MELEDCLGFKLANKNTHKYDREIISAILNETWESQVQADEWKLSQRFKSGNAFFIAYDLATEEDILYYREKGIELQPHELIPVGILETIAINTQGKYENVPGSYNELANYGMWKSPAKDVDTLMFVDVTVMPTRRGRKGNGEARRLIEYASQWIAENTDIKYGFTYTPDINAVKKWHAKLGAKDSQYVIPNARSRFETPNVNIMDYSDEIARKRSEFLGFNQRNVYMGLDVLRRIASDFDVAEELEIVTQRSRDYFTNIQKGRGFVGWFMPGEKHQTELPNDLALNFKSNVFGVEMGKDYLRDVLSNINSADARRNLSYIQLIG